MECKNGHIQIAGDSYAKIYPQVWKEPEEEEEEASADVDINII
jgi:hypothetical protein